MMTQAYINHQEQHDAERPRQAISSVEDVAGEGKTTYQDQRHEYLMVRGKKAVQATDRILRTGSLVAYRSP
jgi:hypothetical protein